MSLAALEVALSDRYTIERELGQGGMATVYLAEDLKHHRKVAIKVLKPALAAALGAERFLQEIATTATLRHPHILPLYDSGDAAGALFYVMPFAEGETLRERMEREGPLPITDAVRIAREVAEALGHAHDHGVIHRDVKPENIMLEGGHAVLADFGIARAVDLSGGERLTASGMSIGTPAYMSPEQSFAEDAVDGRSDLYALGCILYEMLTGEPPYTGSTPQAIIAKRMAAPVPRVTTLRETVPAALEATISRLLAKTAADRPATAADVITALDAASSAPVGSAVEVPSVGRRRRPLAIAAALAVVLLATWQVVQRRSAGDGIAVATDLLAVMPFSVRGSPDLAYLGEGMVDLMSTKLDGAGTLRAANPRAIIATVNRRELDLADPEGGMFVARQLGAGRYITGDLVEAAGRLRFTARLYETPPRGDTPSPTPVATATAEGRVEALFELVDSLAFALVAGTLSDSTAGRLARLAATTTSSLPALKAYLEGERLMRSGGQFREAEAAFDEAVRLDSTFALGWYRKSLVADWTDAYDVRSSADRALELSAGLSARDRSLVEALHARRHGHSMEAERRYHEHLRRWPDEVEALVQLGEIMFHDGPRQGRSMMEAIPHYERALQLEPNNFDARVHLSRLHALRGDMEALAADLAFFTQDSATAAAAASVEPGGERLLELEAMAAFATTDTARQAAVLRRLEGAPWYYWFYASHAASRFSRNARGAQQMLARLTTTEPILVMMRTNLHLVQGQLTALRRLLGELPGGRTPAWEPVEAFIWTSGAVPPDTQRLADLLPRLRATDGGDLRRGSFITAYEDLTDDFHRFERDYSVILVEIALGRLVDARRDLAALRRFPPLPNLGNLREDAIRALEAELLLQEGDRDGALAVLRQITYETPHASTYHPFSDGSRSRFLRAELELERGDTAVAVGLFRGFDESWSAWDSYHRAAAYQRLGEIAEAQARPEDAIRYYGWLLELWQDADPLFAERRDAISRHRNELLQDRR